MKRSLAALLLSSFLAPAWSADLRGKYTDYGSPTCRTYLEAVARVRGMRDGDPLDAQYQRSWGWIAGYLTSYNMNVPDTYDLVGDRPARQQLAVEAYCMQHPDDNFTQMMATRVKELYFTRQR